MLLATHPIYAEVSAAPPISVSLQSPWPATPLLLEILEAVHTQNADSFWPLLDRLTSKEASPLTSATSDEAVYNAASRALDQEGSLASPGDRDLWNWALAMHTEAPKVTAFWQMFSRGGAEERWINRAHRREVECGSWVAWGEKVLCTALEVEHAIETGSKAA